MLFISKKDIAGIDRQLIQNAVRSGYQLMNSGEYNMPDRVHVGDGDNMLLLMPCFAEKYFATKLVSVFPGASQIGLPVINGIMTLADNVSGKPLAVMDGAAVTAERTGAVGGLAVDILAETELKTAGIFGAGVQGLSQARYLLMNRQVNRLNIFDLNREAAGKMGDSLIEEFPEVSYWISEDADTLVEDSDLIIAATTSPKPLFSDDEGLIKGKSFISIGSFRPDMKEFPDAVIKTVDRVYVDTPFAAKESGDICSPLESGVVAKEDILPFASLVGADGSRPDGTFFFKSVGMALFDLAVASKLYELAMENNSGVELDF